MSSLNSHRENIQAVSSKINPLLNDEKTERKVDYHRKRTKPDRHKEKGKKKILLRDERSKY